MNSRRRESITDWMDPQRWERDGGGPCISLGRTGDFDDAHVFGPEPSRAWESHYTTSQSVLRLPDGSWRLWYASRPKPPFDHKYFAIGTARWAVGEKSEIQGS
ncbi:MAG: hypothetical protein FJ279_31210 [Planctomycetes bacterium]|nr:hypothetical protein [Planctomycetota bacterium]MBM4079632.1 hypothetical protein [Planctomycetota bacterium]